VAVDERRYKTPAFRSAVDSKLRSLAKEGNRSVSELRREFLYQRFLARVFTEDASPWVLKGGVGLLTRIPGARHSRDIDLVHLIADPAAADAELREIGRLDLDDHLRFETTRSVSLSVPDALRMKIAAYAGATIWDNFDIDVSCERHFVAEVQSIRPKAVLNLDGVPDLPAFRLYPVVDQIADKVAAMYERHGVTDAASSRYRDLADLTLLIGIGEIDAKLLVAALRSRERHARNPLALPTSLRAPGPGWRDGYPAEANRSPLTAHLHRLDDALVYVGSCLNPILDGTITSGKWNPADQSWTG
jgi:hypothetical protein